MFLLRNKFALLQSVTVDRHLKCVCVFVDSYPTNVCDFNLFINSNFLSRSQLFVSHLPTIISIAIVENFSRHDVNVIVKAHTFVYFYFHHTEMAWKCKIMIRLQTAHSKIFRLKCLAFMLCTHQVFWRSMVIWFCFPLVYKRLTLNEKLCWSVCK